MGLIFALLSAALAASKDLVSKQLASRLDGTASAFASFAFALPYYVLALAALYLYDKQTFIFSLNFFILVLLRSITDTLAEGMKMHAFSHGDISLVATFFSLSPLFMLVLSPIITGDQESPVEIAAVILTVGGTLLLVYHPSSAGWAEQKKGILLAIGAAIFFSLNSCFDRLAVRDGTPVTTGAAVTNAVFAGFAMTLLSTLFLLPFVVAHRQRQQDMIAEQRGLWLRGLMEVTFMCSKLYALTFPGWTAPAVASVQRLSLVISILGGRLIFKEKDFGRRLAAGALICAGVFLISWLKL